MDIIQEFIHRIISDKLEGVKPRDKKFAIENEKNKVEKFEKYLKDHYFLERLFEEYRLGSDILARLGEEDFYRTLPIAKFPSLFEKVPATSVEQQESTSLPKKTEAVNEDIGSDIFEFSEWPSEYRFNKEQIPFIREEILKLTLGYIALIEYKRWIDENGLELPKCETNKSAQDLYDSILFNNIPQPTIEIKSDESSFEKEINNQFEDYLKDKTIDIENFKNLALLLKCYFEGNYSNLTFKQIKVRGRVKTEFARRLGIIYRTTLPNDTMKFDYLELIKSHIDIFKDEDLFKKSKFTELKLYKTLSPKKKKKQF